MSQFQQISNLQTFNNDLYFLSYPNISLTVDMRKDLYKVDLQTGEISKTLANEVDQYLIVDDKIFAIAKNQIVQLTTWTP